MVKDDRNYDPKEIEVDERFVSARNDMYMTFTVNISYSLLMIFIAYFFGRGDPMKYQYVMGMPLWWFLCLALTAVFIVIIYILTQKVYKHVDVKPYLDEEEMI